MINERSNYDELILYWDATLRANRFLLEPSMITLIEQTIKNLKELKRIRETLVKHEPNQQN